MRALLDINVLIALLDQDHTLHQRAYAWFRAHVAQGWASCPLTQNGCVRIMASPRYPNALPVLEVCARLREATSTKFHEFWPDSLSFLDASTFDASRVHGPRQITDIYLLGLAVANDGIFVTFDSAIAVQAVQGGKARHLAVL